MSKSQFPPRHCVYMYVQLNKLSVDREELDELFLIKGQFGNQGIIWCGMYTCSCKIPVLIKPPLNYFLIKGFIGLMFACTRPLL